MRSRLADRGIGDAGFVAGAEALAFGVLVFVFGTLVILNAWRLVDARFASSAAAREAVRASIDAPVGTAAPELRDLAHAAAVGAVRAHGYEGVRLSIEPIGPLEQIRCAPVRIRATVTVQVTSLPLWRHRTRYDVASVHEELIDPYRTGLPTDGELPCGF